MVYKYNAFLLPQLFDIYVQMLSRSLYSFNIITVSVPTGAIGDHVCHVEMMGLLGRI